MVNYIAINDDGLMSTHTPQEIAGYIDQSFEALGLYNGMVTKPDMLSEILEHEMYLADFLPIQNVIRDKIPHPVSFDPMFKVIRTAILNRHPAVGDFLVTAIKKRLFSDRPMYQMLWQQWPDTGRK